MRTMAEEMEQQGFDLIVTHTDPKTGQVVRQNPYNLIVTGEAKQRLFERPKNSGNVFNKKGQPAGRWVRDEKGKGTHKPFEPHVEVPPELSSEEKAAQAFHEKDQRIAELERELQSIRAEAAKQAAPKQAKPKGQKPDEV